MSRCCYWEVCIDLSCCSNDEPSTSCHLPEPELYQVGGLLKKYHQIDSSAPQHCFLFYCSSTGFSGVKPVSGMFGKKEESTINMPNIAGELEWPVHCIILWKHVQWLCKWSCDLAKKSSQNNSSCFLRTQAWTLTHSERNHVCKKIIFQPKFQRRLEGQENGECQENFPQAKN